MSETDRTPLQLASLLRLIHELPAVADPREAVDLILGVGVDDLGAESAAIATFTSPQELQAFVSRGPVRRRISNWGRLYLSRDLPITVAARDRRAIWIESRMQFANEFPQMYAPDMPVTPAQAVCALPLVLAGVALGSLYVTFRDQRTFPPGERAFLLGLADLCVLWLSARSRSLGMSERRNVDLVEDLTRCVSELRLIVERLPADLVLPAIDHDLGAHGSSARVIESLNNREMAVLALMADGLSNRPISDRLFISEKSVERAVTGIFRKLDLNLRAGVDRRVAAVLLYRTHAGTTGS